MRLLNPSPGELLDRITILDLKIKAAGKLGRDDTHFVAERTSLEEALQTWAQWLRETGVSEETWQEIAQKKNGLAAVNALLWEAEDTVRALPEEELTQLAQLAKRISKLNDNRADLVKELSELYGDDVVHEKIYGTSVTRKGPAVVMGR